MGKLTWQEVVGILMLVLAATGTLTYVDLFGALFELKGVNYTHSGDMFCANRDCIGDVNVTTWYWRICFEHSGPEQNIYINPTKSSPLTKTTIEEYPDTVLFKKWRYGRTLWVNLNNVKNIISTNPEIEVEWLVPTYGKKWRRLRDGDCWNRGRVNKNRFVPINKKPEQTIKWGFNVGEYVEVDPKWFGTKTPVGYGYLDLEGNITNKSNAKFVYIWNTKDPYFFNKSSGMLLSNHFGETWTKIIFCGGYKTFFNEWIYRCNDRLPFTWDIKTDNLTYVNVTGYRDQDMGSKTVRFGIRYSLYVNDTELSVIPSIENIGSEDINNNLGFAWRAVDIQIENTKENDKLRIWNNSDTSFDSYVLNETLHMNFTNLSRAKYEIWEKEFLRLRWNENLNYKLMVDSKPNQYNAPITLAINIGTLAVGQEKHTTLYWIDQDTYEQLYVTTFDATYTDWDIHQGDSPYLWNTDADWIHENSGGNQDEGYFGFANTATDKTGVVSDVFLYFECWSQDQNDGFDVDIDSGDGGGYVEIGTIVCDQGAHEWETLSIFSRVDSWPEIDALSMLLTTDMTGPGDDVEVRRTYMNVTYTPDTTPPSFSANSTNASLTTYNGTVIQINMTITNNAVDYYTLSHNDTSNGAWKNETFIDAGNEASVTMIWNYTIENFPLEGGTMGWQVWANDTAGNPNASNIRTFTVQKDITEPSFSDVKTNASATTFNGTTVQLNITIADNYVGLDYYRIATNNTDGNSMSNQTLIDANGVTSLTAIFNESLAWFPLIGGILGWQVWANDTNGNVNVTEIYTLTVQDGTPQDLIYPTSTLNAPINNSNLTAVNVTFNCTSEDDTNLKNVTLYFKDNRVGGNGDADVYFSEGFESGYPEQELGTHADWTTDGAGPTPTAGSGVNGGVGLVDAANIATWSAHSFNWTNESLVSVIISMDFESSATGTFDDDRIGWMISLATQSSDFIMGVHLEPTTPQPCNPRVEVYYDGHTTLNRRPHLGDLPTISADKWYRLTANWTKIDADTFSLNVSLYNLTDAGAPDTLVFAGHIANSDSPPDDCESVAQEYPNVKYFNAINYPAYKNFETGGITGEADNATFWVVNTGDGGGEATAWHANETVTITGFTNTTTFNKTLIDNLTYTWNCLPCDANDNCNFSKDNYTFLVNTSLIGVPAFSGFKNNASSTTYNGTDVQLNVTITATAGIDFFRITTNDSSGNTWVNETIVDANDANSITYIFNDTIEWFPETGGTYGWKVWANNTDGVVYSAIQTFTVQDSTIDLTLPTVTLNKPEDDSTENNTNVTFNCTSEDNINLENVTLYFKDSGTGGSGGAIDIVQSKTNFTNYTLELGEYNLTILLDAPATTNNLLITGIAVDKDSGGISAPSGFTMIETASSTTDVTGVSGAVAYKISDGTEQAIIWNWSNDRDATGWVGEYEGLATVDVLDVSNENDTYLIDTDAQSNYVGVTTIQANELAIVIYMSDSGNAVGTTQSFSNDFSTVAKDTDTSGSPFIHVGNRTLSSAGAVDTTHTHDGTGDESYLVMATFKTGSGVGGVSWHANETINISGITNTTTFNKTLIDNLTYTWNCEACDNSSNCDSQIGNYTFLVNTTYIPDNTFPNVFLIAPANNTYWDIDNTPDFNYSAWDASGIDNCSLYINGTFNASFSSNANFTNTPVGNGSYWWAVNCSDPSGNWNTTGWYNITIAYNVPAVTPYPPPTHCGFHAIHTDYSDNANIDQEERVEEMIREFDCGSTNDHDTDYLDQTEWTSLLNQADENNSDNYTYLFGVEWTTSGPHIHWVALNPPSTLSRSDQDGFNSVAELAANLSKWDGVGQYNHPARTGGDTDFTNAAEINETWIPSAEIVNQQGGTVYWHWNYDWNCSANSGCETYDNPTRSGLQGEGGNGWILTGLQEGYHLGFACGNDYHGDIPLTPYCYTGMDGTENMSREAVVDTLQARHTWVTTAAKINMSVNATNGTGIKTMGDIFNTTQQNFYYNYTITAETGQTIINTSFFVDGVIQNVTVFTGQQRVTGSFNYTLPDDGTEHFIFMEAIQSDDERGWTSPMYVTYSAAPVGDPDINFTIWDSSSWINYALETEYIEFRCTPTQTDCEPTNQNAGSSQSIYRICNNGTIGGTAVYMNMNVTFANIALKCDDDYTAAGATTLTTSNQTIHGALAVDACTDISCWADYSSPTSGGYFDVRGYVVST